MAIITPELRTNGYVFPPPLSTTWGWGVNVDGRLGNNSISNYSSPSLTVGNHNFTELSAGYDCTFALKADGSVWAWGVSGAGNLGIQSAGNRSSPVQVVGGHSFIKLAGGAGCTALKADGSAWGWGANGGTLGDGTTTNRSSPVQVVGGHSFIYITRSNSRCFALKADGSAWGWGNDNLGGLGKGTSGDHTSSPVQVIGGHSFVKITGYQDATIALKADGSVWAWGANFDGELAVGDLNPRSSPTIVVGGHSFVDIAAGAYFFMALKANGEAWGWGMNGSYQLGIGTLDSTTKSYPVQVIGGHSFIKIDTAQETTIALKADGSAWTWGFGGAGLLGNNATSTVGSPVAVVGGHSFINVSGFPHSRHLMAIKASL
jgi:alpha-tubulin suppressor-like RCC1 family protein